MPKSCFGCCSIRHGVSCIYIFNIFMTTSIIMNDFLYRLSNYYQYYQHASSENSTSLTFTTDNYFDEHINLTLHYNSTVKDSFPKIKWTPLLSEIFMDYIFIIKLAWGVMEFYLNISLKQSTYTVSPEKIYAWLVIYYFNLCSGIIFLFIINLTVSYIGEFEYFMCLLQIIIIMVEIYIVQSYYKQQKLAAISDFVYLKWKYIPKSQSDENRSAVKIIPENPLDQTDDQSGYIPIFVRDLRRANS
ncbi:uncharacterized protein LOC100575840 [Acyrthosiphon pisum]|uniref:ACYPI54654 protein n=1 Tax=Acyrthosiphon pisum TaxID=7029 RepID=C4WTY4_ACYPI|nr:uncharacterized protein LOC100575840 [Acyrthosiphon pisum]BAH71354.1 ACYPI54654 [Acyrthosiphon pisum]|eukprot:XP_008184562.1 PREDICTED: uncharacterized protein LOC100575840 [Acyrthosiphon pisum]